MTAAKLTCPCITLPTSNSFTRSDTGVVNQICVIHETMDGCKKSRDSLKDCYSGIEVETGWVYGLWMHEVFLTVFLLFIFFFSF